MSTFADNVNITNQTNFIFTLDLSTKQLQFGVQEFSGMGMSISEINEAWMSKQSSRPGDSLTWNPVSITVIVDEEFKAFQEAYDFLQSMKSEPENTIDWNRNFTGHLYATTNRSNFKKKFILHDCWISSFSDLDFSATTEDSTPMTLTLEVQYSWYEIKDI